MSAGHDHGTATTNRSRLAIAFAITTTILVAEVIGALWTGSLALLVDAGHMLTDAAGLLMALVAASLALRPPTAERTWGLRRAEVLAAGAQASRLSSVRSSSCASSTRTTPVAAAGRRFVSCLVINAPRACIEYA